VIRQHHGEVRAERVERAMREIDEAAQREDERQPERDQQVIRADQEAVDDLLEDLGDDYGERPGPSGLMDRRETASSAGSLDGCQTSEASGAAAARCEPAMRGRPAAVTSRVIVDIRTRRPIDRLASIQR
jgi:hypothetical protein